MFPVIGDHLKHRFLDIKVEIWAYQEAENDLNAICHLNQGFINLKKVEFSVGQEAKITSK